jgi:nicotinate phosphoribosyltransferase
LDEEVIDTTQPLTIFHPVHTWKKRELTDFYVKDLMVPVMVGGKLVYELPKVMEIQQHLKEEIETMWPATTRFTNPHEYHVDLSDKLWNLKNDILNKRS